MAKLKIEKRKLSESQSGNTELITDNVWKYTFNLPGKILLIDVDENTDWYIWFLRKEDDPVKIHTVYCCREQGLIESDHILIHINSMTWNDNGVYHFLLEEEV